MAGIIPVGRATGNELVPQELATRPGNDIEKAIENDHRNSGFSH